ncbi:MAG: hypothetical protein ACRDRZ_12625 [Pseudonocardiaceae bacterium]
MSASTLHRIETGKRAGQPLGGRRAGEHAADLPLGAAGQGERDRKRGL